MTQPFSGTATVLAAANPTLGIRLADADPQVYRAITAEWNRQESTLEMIASENYAARRSCRPRGRC